VRYALTLTLSLLRGGKSKEGVTLSRHASLLGSQFAIDDTLGQSREAVTGTAPGSSRFKALGASLPKPVPCSSEGTRHADSTDKPPFVGAPARLGALRPALGDPCGAEHLASEGNRLLSWAVQFLLRVRSGSHAGGQHRLHIDANHAGEGGSSPRAPSGFPQVIQKILESRPAGLKP
jgi:hypothetical protein